MTKNIVEKVEKAIGWNDWSVRMDRPLNRFNSIFP